MAPTSKQPTQSRDDTSQNSDHDSPGFLREFWEFVCERKLWWQVPILISLALLGALIALGSSAAAPFIYTLF